MPTLSYLGLDYIESDKSQEISDNKNTFPELPARLEVIFSAHNMIAHLLWDADYGLYSLLLTFGARGNEPAKREVIDIFYRVKVGYKKLCPTSLKQRSSISLIVGRTALLTQHGAINLNRHELLSHHCSAMG